MTTLLPHIELASGPDPDAAVIWLHGLGADGNDFAAIVPELDLSGCRPIRFIFPHAPSMPVTINGGYVMPAWYDIVGTDLQKREDAAGIRRSALAIEALIANEIARGVKPGRIVLAGFSQGCAIALHTGLRHATPLAGIMALSGYLPLATDLATEAHPANRQVPVFMAHGSADPVVALARGEASRDLLQSMGYPVQWHAYPMQHSVHPREIQDIAVFLRSVLGRDDG
jgi:phospholipase/carboxylesterase